jgi:hypothetical protein
MILVKSGDPRPDQTHGTHQHRLILEPLCYRLEEHFKFGQRQKERATNLVENNVPES